MGKLYTQKLKKQIVKTQGLEDTAADFALQYFTYFFHNPEEGAITEDLVQQYTKQFQSMIGVEADGDLDTQTIRAMQTMPRCGCKDYSLISAQASGAPSWAKGMTITYFVESYVSGLSQSDQNSLMALAFQQWANVANLKFQQINDKASANIVISTGRGARDQFDGPSGTLAWAYLPPQYNFKGQLLMRFDLDETWIKNTTDRGILYLNVATHEFGHLLGLDHSKISQALMAPYYAVGITKPQPNDDVPRIQNLYGPPTSPPVTPPTNPTPPSNPAGKVKVEVLVNSLSDIKVDGKALQDFSLI